MTEYLFYGSEARFYPHYEGQTFTANTGDVFQFDVPPDDGCWCLLPVLDSPASPALSDEDWINTPTDQESGN